jgi:hypothetical protein
MSVHIPILHHSDFTIVLLSLLCVYVFTCIFYKFLISLSWVCVSFIYIYILCLRTCIQIPSFARLSGYYREHKWLVMCVCVCIHISFLYPLMCVHVYTFTYVFYTMLISFSRNRSVLSLPLSLSLSVCMYVCMYIYIYI